MKNYIWKMAILFLLVISKCVFAEIIPEKLVVDTNYTLISTKRITRVVFEYTYQVKISNPGSKDISGGSAQVTSNSQNTKIIDGKIDFGFIPRGASVTSSDTFTITQDRTYTFNPANLNWVVTPNSEAIPIANAGNDMNALVQNTLKLDGSNSFDPNKHLINYNWNLTKKPVGSQSILIGANLPNPAFIPDVQGEYIATLVVNNGNADSASDEVIITASQNIAPPNANAGVDKNVFLGEEVTLDGSQSSDPNNISLNFLWAFSSLPSGSQLTSNDLLFLNTPNPKFTPDVEGVFDIKLQASNGSLSDNDNVSIKVKRVSAKPNADAGLDFTTKGDVALDGSASYDPDNLPAPLTYKWEFVTLPRDSQLTGAAIQNGTTAKATFKPDKDGAYVLRLTVSDGDNNASDNVLVIADNAAPELQFNTPRESDIVTTSTPTLSLGYNDSGSGVDNKTFHLTLNGVDVTANTTISDSNASYKVVSALPAGANQATATITDLAGNTKTVTVHFTVSVFRAVADCSPTQGKAPLSVSYRSRSEFTGGSIVRYQWDFDGNGTYDTSDSVASDYTRTWSSVGKVTSKLQVTNNLGQTASDTCTITVNGNAPTVTANATPSNGSIPLNVTFTCSATASNGSIAKYEWDFDGNGVFDYSSASSGNTNHIYNSVGKLTAICRVTDSNGLTNTARTTTTTISPALPGSPSVTATTSTSSGNAPLTVNLNGSAVDNGTIKLWEWDFEGDGVYDYSSTTSAAKSYTYNKAGIFAPTLRATDNDGNTGVDSTEVIVNLTATLAIPSETIDSTANQSATINTTLSAGVPVKLLVKNKEGQVIRTLVQANRAAGNYADIWNGLDDAGKLVQEGVYYAVLEYDFSGETRSVDLTSTTGGSRYNPSRTGIPGSFAPLAGQPLVIDFTLNKASEVTAFIGRFNVDTRLVTFYDRLPFGKGTYRIVWNGESAEGQLIHPPSGDSFLFGIWGYNLPNNAMFVKNSAQLSGLSALPSIFVPSDHPDANGNPKQSDITFSLSKQADVELIVFDATTGSAIVSRYFKDLPSGSNTVHWDGRDKNGTFVAAGRYRLGMAAIDSTGHRSIRLYTLQRVYY